MLSAEFIDQLRKKQSVGPYIYLTAFFDNSNNEILNLAKYENNYTYLSKSYKSLPYILSFPNFTQDLGQRIQMTFPNFDTDEVSNIGEKLKITKKVKLYLMNVERNELIIGPVEYYLAEGDAYTEDLTTLRITFSRKLLQNMKYPFKTYNSEEHPTLFKEYEQASFV